MAQQPSPIKLFQIEEPDGPPEADDGLGMAVGIELSKTRGAAVAASVGGNAELLVKPEPGGIGGNLDEKSLTGLLRDLRALAEKAVAQPVPRSRFSASSATAACSKPRSKPRISPPSCRPDACPK